MSHEIYTSANGQAAMAFCGKLPWHSLGQRLDPASTIEQWIAAAGFDWSINRAPVEFQTRDAQNNIDCDRDIFDGWDVLYRSDTRAPLSVVSSMFKPLQPKEVIEFFRDIAEVGGMRLHTAGVLQGGRKLWAMAKNGLDAEVVPGDRVRGNLLLATAADGTMNTTATLTNVRVVCANTLTQALRRTNGGNAVKVSHRSVFNATEVKSQLGDIDASFKAFLEDMRALATKQFSPEQAKELLMSLFAKPAKATQTETARTDGALPEIVQVANAGTELAQLLARGPATAEADKQAKDPRAVGKVLDLFRGAGYGANHEGVHGTGWGLLNAVTQYVDHDLGRTADSRIASAWFGRGEAIKNEARQLLQAA